MKEGLGIRIRVFFSLIGLLVLVLSSLLLVFAAKNASKKATYRNLQILAENVATNIERLRSWGYSDIKILARNPIIASSTLSSSEKVAELQRLQKLHTLYDQISLIDPEGGVVASTRPDHLKNWTEEGWFRKAKDEKVLVSDLYVEKSDSPGIPPVSGRAEGGGEFLPSRQITLIFAVPVLGSGNKVLHVLASQLNLSRIWEITDRIRIGRSGYIVLIDKKGRILAHPDKGMILKPLNSPELLEKLLYHKPNIHHSDYRTYHLSGIEVLAAYSPLFQELEAGNLPSTPEQTDRDSQEWWTIAVQSESEALALVRAVEIWTWLMLGIGLFLIATQALGKHTKNLKQLVQDKTLELKIEREKAEVRARNLETVNDISQLITSTLNLEEVLRLAVTTAGEILDAHQCVLMFIEKEGGRIRSRYEYYQGKPQTELIDIYISLDHYPEFKQAIQTQKPVVISHTQRDPLIRDMSELLTQLNIQSILVFPLLVEGEVLGLLALRWREKPHMFKKEEIHLGEIIANQIAIALKNAQLFAKERELEQMREEFTSMIVHDLKNPLAAITGFSDLLVRRALKENRVQDERYLRNILYYANLLLSMVHNILVIHKIEEGTMELHEEIVPIAQLIQAVVKQFEVLAEEEGITVVTEVPDHLPPVQVDNQLFMRLLTNILHNGIKQTPRGGKVTLRVKKCPGGELCIEIQDTGIGIPAEFIDKIFDKFVQVKSRRTGAGISVGLGLYFCKLAAVAHGGKIWVESQEGKGSTFYLTIPANRVIK